MMAGGVIALSSDTIGTETLRRWYEDYRSGNAERTDILKAEIAIMLRRASVTGWDNLMDPWIESVTPTTKAATPLRYAGDGDDRICARASVGAAAGLRGRRGGGAFHPNYALNLFTSVMNVSLHKFVVRMRLIRGPLRCCSRPISRSKMSPSTAALPARASSTNSSARPMEISPREMRSQFLAHV